MRTCRGSSRGADPQPRAEDLKGLAIKQNVTTFFVLFAESRDEVCLCSCDTVYINDRRLLAAHPELRSCGEVEVDVLGSLGLLVLIVSVDVKQHLKKKKK